MVIAMAEFCVPQFSNLLSSYCQALTLCEIPFVPSWLWELTHKWMLISPKRTISSCCSTSLITTYTQTMDQWRHHPHSQQCSYILGWLSLGHHNFKTQLLNLFTWKRRKEKNICNIAASLNSYSGFDVSNQTSKGKRTCVWCLKVMELQQTITYFKRRF